jgi:hypothetical protein
LQVGAAQSGTPQRSADGYLAPPCAAPIVGSVMSPAELTEVVTGNLNRASPEMAVFRKTRGADGPLRPGDEFVVRMPGPWEGPVRVVRRDAASFRLATLDGHLEAGQIEFRVVRDDGGPTSASGQLPWPAAGRRAGSPSAPGGSAGRRRRSDQEMTAS